MARGDEPAFTVEDSGDATASGGSVANSGIIHGPVNIIHLPRQPEKPPADPLPEIREKFRRLAGAELATLVDWGQMRVPWHSVGHRGPASPALATEADLARHVAGGGTLVIVGASQSGKTTLAYSLMARLDQMDIPSVILRLRSWAPQRQRLEVWISSVLRNEYGLHGDEHQAAIEELREGRIVPIFDGFDEVSLGAQPLASQALRQFTGGRRGVLTGIRTDENSAALDTAIPDAEMISLDPVRPDEVGRFLMLKVPPTARSVWQGFTSRLGTEHASAARVALSSPLNAWLAKTVYAAGGEITDLLTFGTPAEIERHLLERTVGAVFLRSAGRPGGDAAPGEFPPEEAERWLGFLGSRPGSRAIAFWQIRRYAPTYRIALAVAAVLGAASALLGRIWSAPPAAATLFLLTGVIFGFGYTRGYSTGRWLAPDDPTRLGYLLERPDLEPRTRRRLAPTDGDFREHARKLLMGTGLAATCYLATAALWWPTRGHADWWLGLTPVPFLCWVAVAAGLAPAVGYAGGRISARVLRMMPRLDASTGARTAHPLAVIRNDRRSGLGMLVLASILLAIGYLVLASIVDPPGGLRALVAMPAGAIAAFFFWNQWAPFRVAHLWLFLRDLLPWEFARFLSVCHEAGILRQNGNHFTFRHDLLQQCLAAMYRRRGDDPAS